MVQPKILLSREGRAREKGPQQACHRGRGGRPCLCGTSLRLRRVLEGKNDRRQGKDRHVNPGATIFRECSQQLFVNSGFIPEGSSQRTEMERAAQGALRGREGPCCVWVGAAGGSQVTGGRSLLCLFPPRVSSWNCLQQTCSVLYLLRSGEGSLLFCASFSHL